MVNSECLKVDAKGKKIKELSKDFENQVNLETPEIQNLGEGGLNTQLNPSENFVDIEEKESDVLEDDIIDEQYLLEQEKDLNCKEKYERHNQALEEKTKGNEHFKNEEYVKAVKSYTEGLKICPLEYQEDRSILYANRAASKAKTKKNRSAIEDCTKAIELNHKYVKAYLRRARLYKEIYELDKSLDDYKQILELDSGNKEALAAQIQLHSLINERNEKLKEEMLGKLKDLGNVFLRPFGLSTNNFQLTQDPNTGGYSVNFQQKS